MNLFGKIQADLDEMPAEVARALKSGRGKISTELASPWGVELASPWHLASPWAQGAGLGQYDSHLMFCYARLGWG